MAEEYFGAVSFDASISSDHWADFGAGYHTGDRDAGAPSYCGIGLSHVPFGDQRYIGRGRAEMF